MSRDRVINLKPGHVELQWDDDAPVLAFIEHRNGSYIRVRVRVDRFVGRTVAWCLHKAAGTIVEHANDLLKSLRGGG
jgi:hypothetical protein